MLVRKSLLVVLLGALSVGFSPTAWAQATQIQVTSEAANVRSGPGVQYAALVAVDNGIILTVQERRGSWYQVSVPPELGISAKTGYIHRSTVTVLSNQSAAGEAPRQVTERPRSVLERPNDPFEVEASEELDSYELQRNWTDRQWREYDQFDKNNLAAAGLEWLVPTLGHAYVDKAGRGLVPALVSAGGLTLAIIGTQVGCSEEFLGSCVSSGNTTLVWSGILGYIGGRIWGIVSATDYAEEYNRELVGRISNR